MRNDQAIVFIRVMLWGGIVLLGIARWFDVHPIAIVEPEVEKRAEEPPKGGGGELLVVVDPEAVKRSATAGTFSKVDWSYGWINLAEQEFGAYTVTDRDGLGTADLAHFRYIILTQSMTSTELSAQMLDQLEAYAKKGGVLIVERPRGRLRERFSSDGTAGEHVPQKLIVAEGLVAPFDTQLSSMPLLTTYIASTAPRLDTVPYLLMDNKSVVYRLPLGKGHVITVEFDLGKQLVSLQQGRPEEDFSVVNRYPDVLLPALETNDMAAHRTLLDNPIPYADLLERFLVHGVISDARPVVSLWPFPRAAQGVLLMTHDEEEMGNKSAWMAQYEKERGVRSTYFVIATEAFDKYGSRRVRAAGSEVQLHWVRPQGDQGLYDDVGVWKINPFRKARSLQEQKKYLATTLPSDAPVRLNRNHYLLWSSSWAEAFRNLAAAGFTVDSSYGPDLHARGYLFGTGLPFEAMDDNGLPVGVTEMPFLTAETLGGVDAPYMARLFNDSRDAHHQAINVLFHPNAYSWAPSVELFDLWLATYDLAEATQHEIVTMSAYHKFFRSRRSARLRSSVRRIATVEPEKPEIDDGPAMPRNANPEADKPKEIEPLKAPVRLRVSVDAPAKGHTIAVPSRALGLPLRKVWRGDPDLQDGGAVEVIPRTTEVVGHRIRLIPLRRGPNLLTVEYRR